MAMKVKVKIENLDQTVEGEVGEDLRQILVDNDIPLYEGIHNLINCRGKGLCGTCLIEVAEGAEKLSDASTYEKVRAGKGRRLACQTRIYGDATVRTLVQPAEIPA